MIKDKIISKPNKLFEFSDEDDKEAVDLLFELGLIDEFSISHPPGKTTVQVITGDLPTHHVIATRCAGNLGAEENGYWVLCIPKSQYSVEEVNDHMQTIVGRFQSQGMAIETMKPMFLLIGYNHGYNQQSGFTRLRLTGGNQREFPFGNGNALVCNGHQRVGGHLELSVGTVTCGPTQPSTTARPFRQRRDGNKQVTFRKTTKPAGRQNTLLQRG